MPCLKASCSTLIAVSLSNMEQQAESACQCMGGLIIRTEQKLFCEMLSRICTGHNSLPLATMNVAGPSRLHPAPGERGGDNYEEDLTNMIAQLNLADIETLQAVYDDRVQRGDGLSDHEVAFALLMQNARELAEINTDRVLAQRLAVEGVREDPAPR